MPVQDGRSEVPVYPDDLLHALQSTLAMLADIETRYEIERDHLESWAGPRMIKDQLMAELEKCHGISRGRLTAYLERLNLDAGSLEPATPKRTDH